MTSESEVPAVTSGTLTQRLAILKTHTATFETDVRQADEALQAARNMRYAVRLTEENAYIPRAVRPSLFD